MSILNPFRKLWATNLDLQKHNKLLLEENEILKAEIIVLKNLLFNLELDEISSIDKK